MFVKNVRMKNICYMNLCDYCGSNTFEKDTEFIRLD